ncbi:MAG: class I SAM-dependent methyltransferase, partial [Xanthomonadales bacterium]|nr:methyltransferase [Gammaproteobacteria bacterium]NNK04553.1 class I SAM-dependent methyltransferase [Xanthomonadales bacterium]
MKYLLSALLIVAAGMAIADDFDAVEAKLKAAMAAEIRTDAEKERDRNRRPIQTLEFFGLRDDMKVVELLPGGGWYTKLLAPVVQDNGEFYAALGTGRVSKSLITEPGFEDVQVVATDSKVYRKDGARLYTLETNGLGVTDADMVLTFRNYHNFDAEGRAAMNKAAFDALKPGGVYAVVDHTRRHM